MALIENPQPERYGGVRVENGWVTGFTGRGQGGLHFVGVQMARREAFVDAVDGQPSESVREIYPGLMRRRPDAIGGWATKGSFSDIGTAWSYLRTALAVAGPIKPIGSRPDFMSPGPSTRTATIPMR